MEDQIHENEQDNAMEIDDMEDGQAQVIDEQPTPETEIDANSDFQSKLVELEKQVQVNLEGWQRSRAEFTNYRRRTQQELAESKDRGALDAVAKMLPIIDDFERALNNIPEEFQDNPWMSGTALILKNMHKLLDDYKVEELDPVGEEFNPNFHEAIGMDDSSDYESGIVTTTLQKGYKSGERVLRPALVRVAN